MFNGKRRLSNFEERNEGERLKETGYETEGMDKFGEKGWEKKITKRGYQ